MKKGEQTRERIIEQAAALFNTHGYAGVSLNEIIQMTGIQKGGIYRHFTNKDEIALAAYDYAVRVVREKIDAALAGKASAFDKLIAFFEVYGNVVDDPPFTGGCPLLNTAVENDDGHPLLLEKARHTLAVWKQMMKDILQQGIDRGEFRKEIDEESLFSFFIASLEGGILLSKLEGSNQHMGYAIEHISGHLKLFLLHNPDGAG
ncbi:transcriptional regulator, TetR family [Paenibacillus curdlanolyticus YK9]|uniref:Transcriptional regulator, TetR family n=1 Tax=Paenibacillus curdlanolyticus YK9 TaxID=717606 RepID=E0I6E7_9BACL|nr:TetR/AcrR family transcriptional regulator [Paenibacillus curdlanolyticus]EFM11613.1 transcriptional regulator, TetR family [Paenibacillus curdlanolyticus YK9]